MSTGLQMSRRIRRTPYMRRVEQAGVRGYTVVNHMLLPKAFGPSVEDDYWHLREHVQIWDVSTQRQVEITGADALRLVHWMTPRDLRSAKVGQCLYVPLVDVDGCMINDPVLLKLAEDRFWLSIADSDVLFWARAVAGERKLDVTIFEPDVSPLAIQGPKADDVVGALLGDEALQLRHFQFREMSLQGIPLMVARSGWSLQGGFELYLMDGSKGIELWNLVKEAGKPFNIGPGNPNPSERTESGLLSWGGDTDDDTNPFEVRMGRYIDLDAPDDVIGCLLYTSPSPRDRQKSRMPSSA